MRRFIGGRVVVLLVVSSLIAAACSSGTSPSDLIQVRERHTATLLENGQVLVVGGGASTSEGLVVLSSAELYDPATGWSPASVTSQGREEHTATLLSDGRVLVAGGGIIQVIPNVIRPLATAEVYDPATNTWTQTGSMKEMRDRHTATLLADGHVLVVGGDGESTPESDVEHSSAELYDPSTGTWFDAASMAEPRSDHTATLLTDGRVLVIGGDSSGGSAEVYDPSSDSWSSAGSMSEQREDHTATLLDDGRVLVVGGRGADEDQVLASVEVFDPATGSWSAASAMEENRSDHAAILLDGGRVLIVGGIDEDNHTYSSTEIYNPSTGSWTKSGKIRNAREEHSATLLADGKVLIAGGAGEGGERPALTEVFDPATNDWMPAAEQR